MTYAELIELIEKTLPDQYIRGALDFGNFLGFFMCPKSIPKDQDYEPGPYVMAIDKKTGKIYSYNILDDTDLYRNAKVIEIKS